MSDHFADELERALAQAEAEATPEAELAAWRAMGPLVMRLSRERAAAEAEMRLVGEMRERAAAGEQAWREAAEAMAGYVTQIEAHRYSCAKYRVSGAGECDCGRARALALLERARGMGS